MVVDFDIYQRAKEACKGARLLSLTLSLQFQFVKPA